ncbi:MAG: ubiquinone biosynthesis accessory factor UbiJ [Enterobacteriaceae bacterium]
MLKSLLCAVLEQALNHQLYRDRALQMPRQRLVGKVLQLEFSEISAPLTLLFSEQRVDLQSAWQGESDCRVTVSILQLGRLRDRRQLTDMISSGDLKVQGDPQVIQLWAALLEAAEWDLAEFLSPWLGDIAAQGISQCASQVVRTGRQLVMRQKEYLAQALTEEWKLLPGALEIAAFNDQVSEQAERLTALTARLDKMEHQA